MRVFVFSLGLLAAATAFAAAPVEKYGAALATGDALPLAAVVQKADAFAGKTVKVTGTVSAVCAKKGCWMTLKDAASDQQVRITFKDYKFFMPKDCAGATATIEGVFSVKALSEELAKHYAEDAGKDPSTVKGPQKELSVIAAGVELQRNPI